MEHAYIEEQQVIDRYLMGRLSEDELAAFEEHYLACAECLGQLALAEAMSRGFKRTAGQDAEIAAARQLAFVAWLSRLGRSRQAAVLATGLLVALLLPAGVALRETRERRADRSAASAALAAEKAHSRAGLEQALAEAERLRTALAGEQQARARAEEGLAAARAPQTNVPILFLSVERSAPGTAPPTYRLRLPEAPGWIVLAPEVDPPHRQRYRAVLRDGQGREVWRGGDLARNQLDALSLSLPSTLFAPGDYTLEVEGRRFRFRVLAPQSGGK